MRQRRTKAQIAQLQKQMFDVLAADHPQSVRHVFYRMTDPRLPEPVEKSERGYVTVQRQLTNMRRDRSIPYSWLSDATRAGYFVTTYDHPADALEATAQLYRRNVWASTPCYVEVWCESRSIAGVIQPVTTRYAVPLYPAGGFASLSLLYEASEYIRVVADARPVRILYIGDFDPAGVLIDKTIEAELRAHLPDHEIELVRLGITAEQIEVMGLPTKPAKAGDKRGGFTGRTVEAEAMPAQVLRGILSAEIEAHIPENRLHVLQEAEASEREWITAIADAIRNQEAA